MGAPSPVELQITRQSNQNLQERTVEQLLPSAHGRLFILVLIK